MKGEILQAEDSAALENIEGLTISLEGDMPKEGYVYFETKATEVVLEEGDLGEIISLFINEHLEQLRQPGIYVGIWKEEGNYYIDVVQLVTSEAEAIEKANKNGQLAVYDLSNRKTIYL